VPLQREALRILIPPERDGLSRAPATGLWHAIMIRMLRAAVRRAAALRHPPAAARIARALWIAWAIIVWNVAFDHVIVVAGRNYINAASLAADGSGPDHHQHFVAMDDWMRPAVTRGLWVASATAGAILVAGLAAVSVASRGQASLLPDR
jgi:hypothetical protein